MYSEMTSVPLCQLKFTNGHSEKYLPQSYHTLNYSFIKYVEKNNEKIIMVLSRPRHRIHNPKSESKKLNLYPIQNIKKYLNISCKVVQNISKKTDPNVQTNIQYNYMKHEYILQISNFIFILKWCLTISILKYK